MVDISHAYDVFTNIDRYGIHSPINFHAFSVSTAILPFNCLNCNKLVYPFATIGTCLKCYTSLHRNCCSPYRILCPNATCSGQLPHHENVFKSKNISTQIQLDHSLNLVIVCSSEVWMANLLSIWRNVSHKQLFCDIQLDYCMNWENNVNTFDYDRLLMYMLKEFSYNNRIQQSFLNFTLNSLLMLYLHEDHPSSKVKESNNLQLIQDSRNCTNAIIQACLLYIIESCNGKLESTKCQYYRYLYNRLFVDSLLWKYFINSIEKTALQWNNESMYKKIWKYCAIECNTKEIKLRKYINDTYGDSGNSVWRNNKQSCVTTHSMRDNSKFQHLDKAIVELIIEMESITRYVTVLNKLQVLVCVLRKLSSSTVSNNTPNEHTNSSNDTVETDVLLQRFVELLRYSYLSGNGVNWSCECYYMSHMIFGGVVGLMNELDESSKSIFNMEMLSQDWLLGIEGYALATLQQALECLYPS